MKSLLFFSFALLIYAKGNIPIVLSSDRDENIAQSFEVCYSGILGSFIEDPYTKNLWYVSYELKGEIQDSATGDFAVCLVGQLPDGKGPYVVYRLNKLSEYPGDIGEIAYCVENCDIGKVFGEPIVKNGKESEELSYKTKRFNFGKTTYPSVRWLSKDNSFPNDNISGIKQSHFFTSFQSTEEFFDFKISKERNEKLVKFHFPLGDISDTNRQINHDIETAPFYTSNGCWLIIPSSNFHQRNYTKLPLSHYTYRYTDFVLVKKQLLKIYSLNESTGGLLDFQCSSPGWRESTGREILETKPDPLGNKTFVENSILTGVDYSAYSPLDEPNKLHIVYQPGFESDSCYPEDKTCEHKPNERRMAGDLVYVVFERVNSEEGGPSIVSVPALGANITKHCAFQGWEYSPKFSRDKSRLFFLAMSKKGDDRSKSNLYVVNTDSINSEFKCNDKGKKKNVFSLTSKFEGRRNIKFDYPILTYSLTPDLKQIVIVFEEKGESVVRFYKYNKEKNEIVYEYPETISGIGKIYDISSEGFHTSLHGHPIYYVIHSQLNHPPSISRCYFSKTRFICGNRYSPIHTTSYGKVIDSPEARRVSIQRMPVKRISNYDKNSESNSTIDVFILKPRKSNGQAIISVHGGPNEAWDGRFSPRDFRLAELGYTIYMPNPAGSTGYGYDFTSIGSRRWGTVIFNDIKDVIEEIDRKDNYKKLYLMGFSFGGYMVNWVQTSPDAELREKIDAYIAVSGLFDIREFASSTDQLWFPEHQLGCSYPESLRDRRCELDVVSDRDPKYVKFTEHCRNHPPPFCKSNFICPSFNQVPDPDPESILVSQNPACRVDNLVPQSRPTLIISGGGDQRIPFIYNVQPMLNAYRGACAPHTVQKEEHFGHDVPGHRAENQGNLIDRWLQDIETCDLRKENGDIKQGADYLNCEYQIDRRTDKLRFNPYAINRTSKKFVFDNPICYQQFGMLDEVSEASCYEPDTNWNEPHLNASCLSVRN